MFNTYSECVFAALDTQHAMDMCHIIICGLPRPTIFSHIISQTARFLGRKKYWTQNVCFDFLYTFCVTFLILRRIQRDRSKTYIGRRVKYRHSCPILMKIEFSSQIFEKYSNIEFHENPSRGSWIVACGQTDGRTDEQTDGRAWRSEYSCFTILPTRLKLTIS
jgi:hypothetical protein